MSNYFLNEGFDYIHDTFSSINEDAFNVTDLSTMSHEVFKYENAMDFLHSPSKINKSYSSSEVLGIFEGCFFMPDGYSRNKRFYEEQLWINTLIKPEVNNKLLRGGMLGMFEHPNSNNKETKDGIITSAHPHYGVMVTKVLKIMTNNNGRKFGYGKSYILNTPAGRVVNVLLRSKDEEGNPLFKLAVSTRAWAKTKGKDNKGNDIMDPNNYFLDNVDLVMDPGIPEAIPTYRAVESAICKSIDCGIHCKDETKNNLIKELSLKYLVG